MRRLRNGLDWLAGWIRDQIEQRPEETRRRAVVGAGAALVIIMLGLGMWSWVATVEARPSAGAGAHDRGDTPSDAQGGDRTSQQPGTPDASAAPAQEPTSAPSAAPQPTGAPESDGEPAGWTWRQAPVDSWAAMIDSASDCDTERTLGLEPWGPAWGVGAPRPDFAIGCNATLKVMFADMSGDDALLRWADDNVADVKVVDNGQTVRFDGRRGFLVRFGAEWRAVWPGARDAVSPPFQGTQLSWVTE